MTTGCNVPPVSENKTAFFPTTEILMQNKADANVVFVKATQEINGSWVFQVIIEHPDTGWDDYVNGWDVLLEDGAVLKPDASSEFTRLLLHPHVDEQPFTRSQSNIAIPAGVTRVIVRAHDIINGFGGEEVRIDLSKQHGEGFEVIKK